ncbi:hypothetical protein [Actinoplanes sp. NPDC049265]|uniref:hypothetical protein n=1 Tax=Actinoplanes sp. NPDC049265 TaxID=3363902 RepID=UPI003713FB68
MDRVDEDLYTYRALRTDVPALGEVMPPVLDLTAAAGQLWAATADDYDEAALAAVLTSPDVSALWRSWRVAADTDEASGAAWTRVYVLEAADPEVAGATLRAALAEAGPDSTLILGMATGDPVSPAARAAIGSSVLVWALDGGEPISVARVFDGVDPDTGPYFQDQHPKLDGYERDAALNFLDSGHMLVTTPQLQIDVMDPQRGAVVPMNFRTDGVWVWTDTVAYYLREHGLAPDQELLAHAREASFVAAEADAVGLHRALACLFLPSHLEPVAADGVG